MMFGAVRFDRKTVLEAKAIFDLRLKQAANKVNKAAAAYAAGMITKDEATAITVAMFNERDAVRKSWEIVKAGATKSTVAMAGELKTYACEILI